MDITTFWNLIETTHEASGGDVPKQAELLIDTLSKESVQEILEFRLIYRDLLTLSYRANLWDAAYVILCGCSDSGFDDFRGWLIAQGKTVFEEALKDPESLADILQLEDRENAMNGHLNSVDWQAYELKTGQDIPVLLHRPELIGKHLAEADREAAFPRLVAKLGNCADYDKALFNKP